MFLNFSFSKLVFRILTIAVFGAAVHICIILFLPYLASQDAWGRLDEFGELNEIALLPDVKSGQRPLPFMAPDVQYAACRYDLSNGPVQLRSPLPNDLWSIALYSRQGENYYLISGRDVQSQAVNLLIVEDKNIDNKKQNEQNPATGKITATKNITISAPTPRGIILIRAPVLNSAFVGEVTNLLEQAFCRPITFAQQATR